ncbi:MAG TPA: Wzz/FepE/Etk N-terminal domain-containing protein [Chloroflexota bacterium]|nr:Wzz/FepE/Etk N-terminal domain-containing protein [Chloroflexota bacterium]
MLPPGIVPYVAFVLRWWWLILVVTAVGCAATVAYLKFGPQTYQSTALIVAPQETDPSTGAQRSPNSPRGTAVNYAAQAASQHVFELTSTALQGKLVGRASLSTRDLLLMSRRKQVEIKQQRNSNVVSVTVTNTNPRDARTIADTIAAVFVEDTNARTRATLDAHKTQLEQQIDLTRQQLITSQLRQREEDLSQDIRRERTQLLQLQLQYQQEAQRQLDMDRALSDAERQQQADSAAAGASTAAIAAAQQRARDLLASSSASTALRLDLLRGQQQELEQSLAETGAQLTDVRAALATLGGVPAQDGTDTPDAAASRSTLPPSAVPAGTQAELDRVKEQQAQRKDLTGREDALVKQIQDANRELLALQQQYQQEVQRQVDAQQAALRLRSVSAGTPQPTLTPDQQRQLDQLSAAATEAGKQRLELITQQRDAQQRNLAGLDAKLREVRAALSALPSDATLAAAATQVATQAAVQSQTDAAQAERLRQEAQSQRDRKTQLLERDKTLSRQIDDQRAQLRQVQLQIVQELDKQAETERQVALSIPPASTISRAAPQGASDPSKAAPAMSPAQFERLEAITRAAAATRVQWLQVTTDQQQEVSRNIAALTDQLADVRRRLAERPDNGDPLLDAAFTTAYQERLQTLTGEYVKGRISASAAASTLERFGAASAPLPSTNLRKLAALGGAGSLAAGIGIAYVVDLVLGWRLAARRRGALLTPPLAVLPANGLMAGRTSRFGYAAAAAGDPPPVTPALVESASVVHVDG